VQGAAELLSVPVERVRMDLGDTDLPFAPVAGGSATTASVGGAIKTAVERLKGELLKLAARDRKSPLAGLRPEQAEFRGGRLVRTDDPSRGERPEAILARNLRDELSAEAFVLPPAEGHGEGGGGENKDRGEGNAPPGDRPQDPAAAASGQKAGGPTPEPPVPGGPYSSHSYGAQFSEVAVDEELGLVRVRRHLGCFACGRILNAKAGRSQFLGGITMGIGMALLEAAHTDARYGRVTNASIAEYLVPVNADVPRIDVMWLDAPDYNASPIGAKGIGEIGITGVAAAIANAVYHATGKPVRDLPITCERLL